LNYDVFIQIAATMISSIFLASADSDFVTGQNIAVDGGT
jgi:hypothetical protein